MSYYFRVSETREPAKKTSWYSLWKFHKLFFYCRSEIVKKNKNYMALDGQVPNLKRYYTSQLTKIMPFAKWQFVSFASVVVFLWPCRILTHVLVNHSGYDEWFWILWTCQDDQAFLESIIICRWQTDFVRGPWSGRVLCLHSIKQMYLAIFYSMHRPQIFAQLLGAERASISPLSIKKSSSDVCSEISPESTHRVRRRTQVLIKLESFFVQGVSYLRFGDNTESCTDCSWFWACVCRQVLVS